MTAFPRGQGDGLDVIVEQIRELYTQLRDLQRPSGTQIGSLVGQVQAALANLNAQVAAAISANSYTKPQIDNLVANPPAGSNVTGNIAASGNVTATGNVQGANGNFPSGLKSLDARNRTLTSGFNAVYADINGQFGSSTSSRRFKKNFEKWATNIPDLLKLSAWKFNRIGEPDELMPKELGFIAEEVMELGFPEFIVHDSEGEVQGLAYERMVVALLELAKYQDARIRTLEQTTVRIKL